MHVQVAWYACMTHCARTGNLYAWTTRGARARRLVCVYDTWCTCGSLVVLMGHVTDKGCTCGSLDELLVTCKTLPEFVFTWCKCGSLGMLI